MKKALEKKTGVLRLGEGVSIPCDATINTDITFNQKLVATIGERMYHLRPDWDFSTEPVKMIVDESMIKEVEICKIDYATNCGVCLTGITTKGEKRCSIQELFFTSYEEAVKAVRDLQEYYLSHKSGMDWVDDYMKVVKVNYRYMLQFPVKPQDPLFVKDKYYVANRVVAFIYPDYAQVEYQGHDDQTYEDGKEVHTAHEYSGVRNEYEIVRLLEQKEQQKEIIDI